MKAREQSRLGILLAICLISTLAVWLPFFSGWRHFMGFVIPDGGMKTIAANYDGPNYLIIARTWYRPELIRSTYSFDLPLEYYPAHFPGFPLTVWLADLVWNGTNALILATLLASLTATAVFYLFVKKYGLSANPFWLTIVFLFLPARWLAVRVVGAPEPLFITAILASFYFFKNKQYWLAGLLGAVAQLTKTPGILLLAGYGGFLLWETLKEKKGLTHLFRAWPLGLIPLAAVGVFVFYARQTGNFWAYFQSGDNFHLTTLPYQAFNSSRSWLAGIWNEDMVWLYLLGGVGLVMLIQRRLYDLAAFAGVFYLAVMLVAHRDITRYSLPAWPFFLIGLDPLLQKKEFKIIFWLVLPAVYFYTLNFVAGNTAPVGDWAPYL